MNRLAAVAVLPLACLAFGGAARAMPAPDPAAHSQSAVGSWAEPQIREIVARGLMGASLGAFRPDDPITRAEVTDLVAGLTGPRPHSAAPSPEPAGPSPSVTLAGLDARLVRGLGLSSAAARFQSAARGAGLSPPARFGDEVVARLLGLRTNHPAARDDLELLPADPATRAEAAFSAAQLLGLGPAETRALKDEASAFAVPPLTDWQRRILDLAVWFIGYPYVWGGTSEHAEAPFGVQAHGGFDCSGFVWRIYKLEPYPGGAALAGTLKGRTTYAMSGEVPRGRRIPLARLEPADVLFFGDAGPKSTPNQVGHMGVYVGGGWFVHSSDQGVALSRLSGWYRDRFAWARRPLAEAGLEPSF
jgi:cell wall-associated NlpC family hydrolase